MPSTQQQLDDLILASTELKAVFEAERTHWETARTNLEALLVDRMNFTGTVDADNADPAPGDGGVFPSITALVDAAPRGAHVTIRLLSGRVYDMATSVHAYNRTLHIVKEGAAADPILRPQPYVNGDKNYSAYFRMRGGEIMFENIELDVSTAKADGALDWQIPRACVVSFEEGASARVGMKGGKLTGADGRGLITLNGAVNAAVSLFDCELSGATFAVCDAASGTARIAKQSLTLTGAAALADGGVRGENLIHN